MRPGPKKPGESAAEYSARVKAMEQRWMSGMGRPKTSGAGPSPVKTPGHVVSDTRGPNYPKIPKNPGETKTQYLDRVRSEKGGPGPGRGMVAADPGSKEMAARNAAARAAEQKAKARAAAMAAEKMKRDGSSSGGGRRNMGPGSGGAPVSGGRGMKRGGMVKGKK